MNDSRSKSDAGELAPRQLRAVALLAAGRSAVDTARAVGVSRRTVERWLADETFCATVRHASDESLRAAVRTLAGHSTAAARALAELIDQADKPGDRIRACDVLLRHVVGMVTLIDLADRITALERRAGAKGKR